MTQGRGPPILLPTMLGHFPKLLLAMIFLGVVPQGRADEPLPQNPSERGIVILRNGEILQGQITRSEGFYVVDLPYGQIRLKNADVELVCASLDEGYRRKRAAIQVGDVHNHLELAGWCLRHNLLDQAAKELADAKVADPRNPMIAALKNRLDMAMEPASPQKSKHAQPAGPSNDDLDRMVRSLPRGAVETFTQSVQPVLMNHCTGSGCHGLQSDTGMKLIRISSGRSPSRRFTQRNLYSVLQYIDQENPSASKLLTTAGGPHGTVQHAIFSQHEASQYKRLVEWVGQVTQHETPAAAPADAAPPPSSPEPAPRTLPSEAKKAHPLPSVKRGPQAQEPRSADPFDPEAFNRHSR